MNDWNQAFSANVFFSSPLTLLLLWTFWSVGVLLGSPCTNLVLNAHFSRLFCRFLMLETAQRLMECTTTSVTTSSTPPTKATLGNAHCHTSLVSFCSTLLMLVRPHLSICRSMYLITPLPLWLPRLDPLSHLSVCALSLNSVSDTICRLSLCQRLSTYHWPVGEAADLANKQSFVRPAQRSLTCSAKSSSHVTLHIYLLDDG